jgi:hypothetical protein
MSTPWSVVPLVGIVAAAAWVIALGAIWLRRPPFRCRVFGHDWLYEPPSPNYNEPRVCGLCGHVEDKYR